MVQRNLVGASVNFGTILQRQEVLADDTRRLMLSGVDYVGVGVNLVGPSEVGLVTLELGLVHFADGTVVLDELVEFILSGNFGASCLDDSPA